MEGVENEYDSIIHDLAATRPDLVPPCPNVMVNQVTTQQQQSAFSTQQDNNAGNKNGDNNGQESHFNRQQQSFFSQQQQQPEQPLQQQQPFTINEMMHSAFVELRMIVEWARKVPNFASLQMGDRVSLLKSSFVDLFLIRLIFRSTGSGDQLAFAQEMSLTLQQCVSLGWNSDVIKSCFSLVDEMRSKLIDLNEFALLCAVVLFFPDAPTLSNRLQVLTFQNHLLTCLQHYSSSRFHGNVTRPGKLMLLLAGVRSVSAGVLDQFIVCTREGRVQMDDLVIEMMS